MFSAPVLIIRTTPGSLAALAYDIQITRFHTAIFQTAQLLLIFS